MNKFWKSMVAGGVALATLSAAAAWADRPSACRHDHDHRSHAADYYNYYPADRYSRVGAYRSSGLSLSISFSDNDHDRRGYRGDDRGRRDYHDDDYGRRNGYRGRDGRVVNREVYDTRYRARIILTEEIVRTRRGPRLICTIDARGPEARYIPDRRLHKIARNNCSHRAEIRIV